MHDYFEWIVSGLLAVVAYFVKKVHADHAITTRSLQSLREELPKEYVSKADYKDDLKEIKDICNRIFEKLDGKADK